MTHQLPLPPFYMSIAMYYHHSVTHQHSSSPGNASCKQSPPPRTKSSSRQRKNSSRSSPTSNRTLRTWMMLSGRLLITLLGSILQQGNLMPGNSLSTRLGVKSRYVDLRLDFPG